MRSKNGSKYIANDLARSLARLLALLLALSFAPSAARAQFRALATALDDARAGRAALPAALDRRLDASYVSVPLPRVLDDLARRAGLGIAYTEEVAAAPLVTLRAQSLTVAELLVRATRGSGWSAWIDGGGQVILRRDAGSVPNARAVAATGADVRVSGTVRRADNREVVRWANLAVESERTQTNADGVYFFRLDPGPHRLVVRALGYAPLDTTLDVRASGTVDLLLTPVAVTLASARVVASRDTSDIDPRVPEMSVARLDLRTVRQTPAMLGEVDPIRSLTFLPGVSRASDFSTAFSVRGGGTDQNLILLDDATIYNPSHVLGFLSVFNSDAVDDVTLHKGAIPVRYGGRLSSVVDVRQRAGNAEDFGGSATIGLLSSRTMIEGPLPGHRGSFIAAARRSYADAFLKASKDTAVRKNSAYFYDLNAKATTRIGATGSLMLSGYAGRDAFSPDRDFSASWGNVSGTARWTQVIANRLFSTVTASSSDYDYGLHFKLVADSVRWTSRIRSRALRADETLHLGAHHTLVFGAEAIAETLHPGDLRASDTSKVGDVNVEPRHAVTGALYLGHELDLLGDRVALRYGARVSEFDRRGAATIYRYPNATPVVWNAALGRFEPREPIDSTTYGAGASVASFSGVEPRASARVSLGARSSVKASYAHTVQYLLLASRTNVPTPLDVWEPSGPYLRPQRADQYALGWTGKYGAYELSAEAYTKQMKGVPDFIDGTDVVLNSHLETGIVQGIGRARGLELYARRTAGTVTGWVSYTLSRAEQRFGSPGAGIANGAWYRAPTDKTHDLSVVAVRPLGAKWTVGATFNLSSGLPTTFPVSRYEIDGLVVAEYGPRNASRLPTYHRLDLAFTRATSRGELQLGAFNVYNRFNAQSLSFRQSTKDPRVTEAVQLSIFGVVPSVSYTRHF